MKRKSAKSGKSVEPTLSPRERRFLTLVIWCFPILFFVLLEGALRLFGYGDSYPLFVPAPNAPEYLTQNHEVARRYFIREERVPTGIGDVFKAEKDTNTTRIFVQGGSSAAGYPYYFGGSFSRMLEQRLQQTFPERTIEVVNTGLAAVNSYTLLDFADEIIAQKPDAILIYAGHNEFYGALGVGSVESLGRYRSVVRLYLDLQNLRILQAFRDLLVKAGSFFGGRAKGQPPGQTLMERMVGERMIPLNSPQYRHGLAQFRGNLRDLLSRYLKEDIPVFIGTLASNERAHKPFISGLAPETDAEAWQALLLKGANAARDGDLEAALAAFDAAIRMDSLAANSFYARARLLDSAGRYAEARIAYLAAKDRDQLRFRATEDINEIIREEAARAGVTVVESQQRLVQSAGDGIIGSDLMLEHLHPNVDGYFLIADAFYEALRQADLFGAWSHYVPSRIARSEVLFTAVDSLFGAYRLRQLMASWPFQPPGVVDQSLDTVQARNQIEELALDLYRKEINWYEATNGLMAYYRGLGDYHRALQAALAVIQQYPFLPRPYAEAGDILLRQRRLDEALVYFEIANKLEESATVHFMMGNIALVRGQAETAIEHLERATALEPQNAQILIQLSKAYVVLDRLVDALETVQNLLQVDPNHQEGRQLRAWLRQNVDT